MTQGSPTKGEEEEEEDNDLLERGIEKILGERRSAYERVRFSDSSSLSVSVAGSDFCVNGEKKRETEKRDIWFGLEMKVKFTERVMTTLE